MKRLLVWLPIVAYSALIFYVSSRPVKIVDVGWKLISPDKVLHFGAYFVWSLLFAVPVATGWPRLGALVFVAVVAAGGIAYGASDEYHQAFVPGRDADPADLVADALGALAGAVVAGALRAYYVRRKPPGGSREAAE